MKRLLKLFCNLAVLSLTFSLAGCGARENSNLAANPPGVQTAAIPVSAPEQDAAEPAIAAAPDGSLYVVWVEHLPQKRANVYIRHFDREQKPLGEAVRVNPEEGRATAWRGDQPTIKIGADNTIYIGWTARVETADGAANELYLSVSRDGGANFDAPVKVNDDNLAADRGMHSLEIDKTGRVFFAWLDERYLKTAAAQAQTTPENSSGEAKHSHGEANREVYFAVSTDNGKTFAPNKKIAANACPCCKTSLAIAPDGRLYIAWRQVLDGDFRHIAVSSSVDGGGSFAPPAIVSDDRWQIAACPVSGAGLAVDSKNNLTVVWFTAGQAGTAGLYAAQSSDGGKTFSPRTLISESAADGTPVLIDDSGNDSRIVVSAAGKTVSALTAAQNASADFKPQSRITDAELPGAALSKDRTYIAFIRKNGEKRSVLLAGN